MLKKKELVEIAKEFNLDFLVLFGSRAKKTQRKNSDYDFAFFKKGKKTNYNKLYTKIWNLFENKDINLIDLTENNSYLLEEEIFKSAIKIYVKDELTYYERRNQTFFNYNDYCIFDKVLINSI